MSPYFFVVLTHFEFIRSSLPVFHIGFLKHTVYILQCICKSCSRVLLLASDRQVLLKRMRSSCSGQNVRTHDALFKAAAFKKVLEKCKKVKVCPYCRANNGTVKKISGASTMKIIHERYKGKQAEDDIEVLLSDLANAMQMIPDLGSSAIRSNLVEDLPPTRVLQLFQAIPDFDCDLLWMDVLAGGRPESLILTNLLVPPVPIRPSVAMDAGAGSNEDDLTIKLQEILDVNVALELALSRGPQTRTIIEEWDFLQVQVAQYINGEMPGLQRPIGAKPIRGLCQRLKGKQGRFRGNLSGKRVDFSARTGMHRCRLYFIPMIIIINCLFPPSHIVYEVISPDPNLRVDQVGVPKVRHYFFSCTWFHFIHFT